MSTKFEQLLDLIVNEEMDKANELFHEIVVEKSRNIYENLIAQEAEETTDESVEEEDVEEGVEEEDVEEGVEEEDVEEGYDDVEEGYDEPEMEDAYSVEGDDEPPMPSGEEESDPLLKDVGDEEGDEGPAPSEDEAMMDIKNAIEELEAAFAELQSTQGGDMDADMGGEFGDEEGPELPKDEMMGMPMEGKRRMTREYAENVGMNWEKGSTMKTQKQYVGAGTGDKEGAPDEGKSPIANLAKPGPTGVSAKNLNQGATEGQSNTGTSPGKVSKGLPQHSGEKLAAGMHNVDGKKSGVKTLSNVKGGHGAEKKGAGPGPVGSGTGDKAGQTSVPSVKQFLKPYSK